MKTYIVEIRNNGIVEWQRTRHTMPAAVDAAILAVWQLHDWLSTRDTKGAWIDHDSAKGWNPRLGDLVIIRRDTYKIRAYRQ